MAVTVLDKQIQDEIQVAFGIEGESLEDDTSLQDAMIITQAFEKGSHMSSTEASICAPITRQLQNMKCWSQAQQDTLDSWFRTSTLDETKAAGLEIENTLTSMADEDFGEKLKRIYEDCIPCLDRLDLKLSFVPAIDFIANLEDDIRAKIEFLTDLDNLIGNVDVYGDICRLIGFLNFMCVPDLQRMISVLMGLLMKYTLSLDGLFDVIASLIVPLFAPIIMGVFNLLAQYEKLVLLPIDCVIDSLEENLRRLSVDAGPIDTTGPIGTVTERLEDTQSDIRAGLGLLREKLVNADEHIKSKLAFYLDQINKLLGDWNGDSVSYLTFGLEKLQIVRLIALISAIIDLKRKGGELCLEGERPTIPELDNFFNNFLNPNSFFKLTVDDKGDVRVEEPDLPTYVLEDDENGAKIISYEPDNLLTVPVSVRVDCVLQTSPEDVDKLNKLIRELDKVD